MAAPTVDDVASLMGGAVNADQAGAVLSIVSALAASYTRGQGFTDGVPADDVKAVILTAAVRMLTDPTGVLESRSMGPFTVSYAPHGGWSTSELMVLNRYRLRAL